MSKTFESIIEIFWNYFMKFELQQKLLMRRSYYSNLRGILPLLKTMVVPQ